MPDSIMYHEGNRQLQDAFDSRRISDRLEEKLTRTAFTADDKAFIEGAIYFLATADGRGARTTGQTVQVPVTARNNDGGPDAGLSVRYTITGANPGSGAVTTGADGTARSPGSARRPAPTRSPPSSTATATGALGRQHRAASDRHGHLRAAPAAGARQVGERPGGLRARS